MKSRTIKSLAITGVLALGLSGCSLIAPVATNQHYDPSDGVGADVANVDVRNLLLIADQAGSPYNVVFVGVNGGEADAKLNMVFVAADGTEQQVNLTLKPGINEFGKPEGENPLTLLNLGQQQIGSTVKTYLQSGDSDEVELFVPVLDGTLPEYEAYVIDATA